MTEPTPREVETACFCAGSPHPRDRFVLPAELPVEAGLAAYIATQRAQEGGGDLEAAIVGAILRNKGIESWNLVDEEGKPLPLTPKNIAARVTWQKGGIELTNGIYAQYVVAQAAPFGSNTSPKPTAESSPNGQTVDLISPKTPSSQKRRARSG